MSAPFESSPPDKKHSLSLIRSSWNGRTLVDWQAAGCVNNSAPEKGEAGTTNRGEERERRGGRKRKGRGGRKMAAPSPLSGDSCSQRSTPQPQRCPPNHVLSSPFKKKTGEDSGSGESSDQARWGSPLNRGAGGGRNGPASAEGQGSDLKCEKVREKL